MNTNLGYSKKTLTDTDVLLSGGGNKPLTDFIGSISWDATNRKLKYTPVGGSATDLVTFGSNAFNSVAYLPLAGGTMTGTEYFNISDAQLSMDENYKIGHFIKDIHILVKSGSGKGINDGYVGSITFGASNSASYAGIYVQSSGSYGTRMIFGTTYSYAEGSKAKMIITNDGKVGIGTMTPSYNLHIVGTLNASSTITQNGTAVSLSGHTHDDRYVTALGTNNNYLTWTKDGTTNNLTVPYATKSGSINNFSNITITVPDNGGKDTITLISDCSEIYDGNNHVSSCYGLIGYMIGQRNGNANGTCTQQIVAYASYNTEYRILKTDNYSTYCLRPMLIHYNNKYYIGLCKKGSGRTHYFIGKTYNLLSTFVNLYKSGNNWYSDSSLTNQVTFTTEVDTSGYDLWGSLKGNATTASNMAYTGLTGSGTTANQAIVSNGTANGWTLKTLGSRAFDSTSYLPLSGGTLTGNLIFDTSNNTERAIYFDVNRNSANYDIGWAISSLTWRDVSNSTFFQFGVYGKSNTFNYAYIGTGTQNSTSNLRIYPDKVQYGNNLIAHAGNISDASATIGTELTTIATVAGVDIKAKIGDFLSYSNLNYIGTAALSGKLLYDQSGYEHRYIHVGDLPLTADTGQNESKVIFTVYGFVDYGNKNESVWICSASSRNGYLVKATKLHGESELNCGYVLSSTKMEVWLEHTDYYQGHTTIEIHTSNQFTLVNTSTSTKPSNWTDGTVESVSLDGHSHSWSSITDLPNLLYTDVDQEISSVKTIKGTTGIRFPVRSLNGTRASFYNEASWIHGGEDNASHLGCNLEIGTWHGLGIYPTISGQTRTQGQNSFWHNARTGDTYTWGDFYKFDGTNNIQACYVGTDQTISGTKSFNEGKWKLTGNDSNDITNEYFINGKLYNNKNTNVVDINYSIKNAIKFTYNSTHWLIGNIRGSSTDTAGFGIALRDNTATNVHLIDCLRIEQSQTTVSGSVEIGNNGSNFSYIRMGYPGSGTYDVLRYGGQNINSADLILGSNEHDTVIHGRDVHFFAKEYKTLTIKHLNTSSGRVGIGTDAPSYKLHVIGDIYASGNITNQSDIRMKNIQNMYSISIDDLANAPSFIFKWKEEKDSRLHVGTSAQYWKDKVPELVMSADDELKTLSLQYGVLGAIGSISIAKEVIKLREQLKNLQNSYDFEVKNLQGQINILQQQIDQFRNQ